MTKRPRQLIAIALTAAAVALPVGCGGSDEPEGRGLPRDTVSELERRLDEIDRRYSDAVENGNVGACDDIQNDSIPAANELVGSLPDDVDPEVRQAVEDSFANLEELAQSDCSNVEPAETEPETTPVPTEPTPPETTPEETTTETTPEKPPKERTPRENEGEGGAEPLPGDPTTPGQGGGALPGEEDDG